MPNFLHHSNPARSSEHEPDKRALDRTRRRLGQAAWALYDWAVSPFTTLIITFVFAAYFQQAVVADSVDGQALWSLAMALAGLGFALTAPFLGAVADARGRLKPWILGFTFACALASAGLWFVEPDPDFTTLALVMVVVGNLGSEYAALFVNALLPGIVGPGRLGRRRRLQSEPRGHLGDEGAGGRLPDVGPVPLRKIPPALDQFAVIVGELLPGAMIAA